MAISLVEWFHSFKPFVLISLPKSLCRAQHDAHLRGSPPWSLQSLQFVLFSAIFIYFSSIFNHFQQSQNHFSSISPKWMKLARFSLQKKLGFTRVSTSGLETLENETCWTESCQIRSLRHWKLESRILLEMPC